MRSRSWASSPRFVVAVDDRARHTDVSPFCVQYRSLREAINPKRLGNPNTTRKPMDDDRILSTHTGSLPRPDDLVRMMWAVGDGIPVDRDRPRRTRRVRRARGRRASGVGRRVDRQRRRDVEAVVRHVRQGPARRVRRRVAAELPLPGSRRLSAERGASSPTTRAAASGRHRPAPVRSRCATRKPRHTT